MDKTKETCGIRMKWLGCACFEIDLGGLTVVSDPWITPNKLNGVDWTAVEKCDLITLSHGHYDHTLDIPALVKKFDPFLLCGENTALPIARFAEINPMSVYPMNPGLELDFGAAKIKAVYGRHTFIQGTMNERIKTAENHPVNHGDPTLIELAVWGELEYRNYLFTLPNGKKLLLFGNRLNRIDRRSALRAEDPDVVAVQLTRRASTTAEELAETCRGTRIRTVIAMHSDFPTDYREEVKLLGKEFEALCPGVRFILPEYNEWMEL